MKYLKEPKLKEWTTTEYMPEPYQMTVSDIGVLLHLKNCKIDFLPTTTSPFTLEITPLKKETRVEPLGELHQGIYEELLDIVHSLYKDNKRIHFIVSNFFIYYYECDWRSFTVKEYYQTLVDIAEYVRKNKLPKWDKSPEYQKMLDYFKEKFNENRTTN